MQQQHSPNDAVSPSPQNILPSPENISASQSDEVVQQESNPTFDGIRRSNQAQHLDETPPRPRKSMERKLSFHPVPMICSSEVSTQPQSLME